MAQVPTGTAFHIASAYSTAKIISDISNASEAVVTCTAHGFANGDIVEITSNWGWLDGRVFRIKTSTTDSFVLEGTDTTSTDTYPPGNGAGSAREVTVFTPITGVLSAASSGGDPKTVTYKYMETGNERSINDGFQATTYTIEIDADNINTAGYRALKVLTDVQRSSCLKMVMRSGGVIYVPCMVALNEAVRLQDGQVNRVPCVFNGQARLTRY